MTFPCPYCHRPLRLQDADVLSEAAAICVGRRKVHSGGRNGGRPVGYRKCPKCGKFHYQEEMKRCNATV